MRPIRIVTAVTRSRAFLAASPCARRPSAPPPTSSVVARRRDPRSRESRHLSRRPPGRGRRGSQAPARVASIPPPPIPASAARSRRPTTGARRPRSGARRARARGLGARAISKYTSILGVVIMPHRIVQKHVDEIGRHRTDIRVVERRKDITQVPRVLAENENNRLCDLFEMLGDIVR